MSINRRRNIKEPGIWAFLALGVIGIALNLAVLAGTVAVIIVILRALGVIR